MTLKEVHESYIAVILELHLNYLQTSITNLPNELCTLARHVYIGVAQTQMEAGEWPTSTKIQWNSEAWHVAQMPILYKRLTRACKKMREHLNACMHVHTPACRAKVEEDHDVFIDDGSSDAEEVTNEGMEDVHAWIEKVAERGMLSPKHMLKYINWGPLPLTKQEEDVAELLSTVCSGTGMSDTTMNKLLQLWTKKWRR